MSIAIKKLWPLALASLTTTASLADTPTSNPAHNYPRLGAYFIGGQQHYDNDFRAFASRLHLAVLGGNWDGWQTAHGYSKESVIASIKSQSHVDSKVFQYVNLNEVAVPPVGAGLRLWQEKVNSMHWWLYSSGVSSALSKSTWESSWGLVNFTTASPKDSSGMSPYAWAANYVNDLFHLGKYNGTSPAPSLDGFLLDNVFWRSRSSGDWNRDGNTGNDSVDSPVVQYAFRAGEKEFFDQLKTVFPNGVQLGNADFAAAYDKGKTVEPLNGVLGGALFEAALGMSWSAERWGSAALSLMRYKFDWDQIAAPKYFLFAHYNVRADGADPVSFDSSGHPTAFGASWQGMRYGLAECLMGDGYYFAYSNIEHNSGDNATGRMWFDEYDGGGLGVGYLGQPTQAFQTVAWSNGVWKRDFQHGIVLWNPKGNGTKTVSLAGLGNLKRLNGKQDTSVNNGAVVTNGTITLKDRDGVILVRY